MFNNLCVVMMCFKLVDSPQVVLRRSWRNVWLMSVRMPPVMFQGQCVWLTTVWSAVPGGFWALRRSPSCVQHVSL